MKKLFVLLILLLVACSTAAEPSASNQATEPANPELSFDIPTQFPTPTLTAAEGSAVAMGMTAEGAFYKGNPEAAVKMIDYSNFL